MVFFCPYLQKLYLVPLGYLLAYNLELLTDFFTKHRLAVLRWANNVIQQYAYIVALVQIPTHTSAYADSSVLSRQSLGVLDPERLNRTL